MENLFSGNAEAERVFSGRADGGGKRFFADHGLSDDDATPLVFRLRRTAAGLKMFRYVTE